jgi:hypothetical protein
MGPGADKPTAKWIVALPPMPFNLPGLPRNQSDTVVSTALYASMKGCNQRTMGPDEDAPRGTSRIRLRDRLGECGVGAPSNSSQRRHA